MVWAVQCERETERMENKMTEEQAQAESQIPLENQIKQIGDQKSLVGKPKKKKASWLRTILWMLSMMLLANVVVGIIAYFLFVYKII
jgi:hypothetical protein